jgi:hypothetical protein
MTKNYSSSCMGSTKVKTAGLGLQYFIEIVYPMQTQIPNSQVI